MSESELDMCEQGMSEWGKQMSPDHQNQRWSELGDTGEKSRMGIHEASQVPRRRTVKRTWDLHEALFLIA